MHQVSETGICHGTKANHHPTLPYQSSNNRQELISTQSVKGKQKVSIGISIMEARVVKASENWLCSLGRYV